MEVQPVSQQTSDRNLGRLYRIRPSLKPGRDGRKGFFDFVRTEKQLRKSICSGEDGFQTHHYRRTRMIHFSSSLRKPTAEPQGIVLGWTLVLSARSIPKYLDAVKAALEIGACNHVSDFVLIFDINKGD